MEEMKYIRPEVVEYLCDWYRYNARILPWREDRDPYHIWVSEIMLQQTRVEAVRGYYYRFLQELPDVAALAAASEERLMKLWQGLGYYSRARNLQKTARLLMEQYDGVFPKEASALKKLPGIGDYTAGAIASIAFDEPVPAVDGNVLRVMMRIAGSRDDITDAGVKRTLTEELVRVMPVHGSGAFNQAIMDLGATVCLPNGKPLCEQCPVMHCCEARRSGLVQSIPYKPPKKERRKETRRLLILESEGRYLIHRRENRGLLAGLWEFPTAEEVKALLGSLAELGPSALPEASLGSLPASSLGALPDALPAAQPAYSTGAVPASSLGALPEASPSALPASLQEKLGAARCHAKALLPARHIFTHVEWELGGELWSVPLQKEERDWLLQNAGERYAFADREELRLVYSIPGAFRYYLERILSGERFYRESDE